ncbi:ribosomal protection-like ABC-F family protein [Dictyobacter formicarum]|uniref:ABC transporter ATP-binding protein n=1 Tax=Dictyobacter formicarum TaxID=2778368 RepID=A0ABQ3VUR4_9CHLR|nr:ABC-F type ribosomal protection protein [Dictyobacter formicarum]GHO89133.1 ABC transporter ATP-binding protein [Dictyobacter formicarum]
MLLTCKELTKSYGMHTVLDAISFVVNATERIGIVGPNGVGKSTLLRLLVKQEELDSGTITYAPNIEFGYLPQTTPDFYGQSIQDLILASVGNLKLLEEQMHTLEAAMAGAGANQLPSLMEEYAALTTRFQDRGGYELDYKIDSILEGLHLTYLERSRAVETLSGGEKARVGLATLLLRSPEILLLDEPTNHLDFASLEWLESYLSTYQGAVVMVSHDRQFLNKTVSKVFEIDEHSHQLHTYSGNYDAYIEAKQAERKRWEDAYEQQQEEIKELQKQIRINGRQVGHSNRPTRDNDKYAKYFFSQNVQSAVARNVRAAQMQLERIEENPIPKPPELLRVQSQFQTEPIQSQIIVRLEQITKSFGQRKLFEQLNLTITPQTRIMLTGPNGTGKTTLLRLINGDEVPDSGSLQVVEGARIGYLAQEPASLDREKTVIETYKYGQIGYEGEFIGRLLGYGFFRLEDMHKQVGQLSVGQKRKLELACLLAAQPNVLLLDEPTNYISLDVLEAFESALLHFDGPIIVISHDRWFIQRFGGEIWQLVDGRIERGQPGDANTPIPFL